MDRKTRLETNRSGYYEIRWTEIDASGRGRTRCVSTRTQDLKHAQAVKRAFDRQEKENAERAAGVTVGALLDGYEASAVARGVGPTQLLCVKQLRSRFASYEVEELTPDALLDYRDERDVTDATLRREFSVLVAALGWAAEHDRIVKVPRIELPPPGPSRAAFLDEPAEAELFTLASQDEGPGGRLSRAGRFITIGLATGARKEAIETLPWERVDLKRGVIDFRDPDRPETKKKRAVTIITDRLYPVLERAFAERGKLPPLAHTTNNSFRRRSAAELAEAAKWVLDHAGSIYKAWGGFMARHQYEDLTPHVMRHTRITLLLRAGVSIWDVSELVGASPNIIKKVYGHHRQDERMRELANRRMSA